MLNLVLIKLYLNALKYVEIQVQQNIL
uniref:Uncharacterized protein n=1 Tax=Anguilla anguilla TaxID=7936 RepID=A0A0E9RVI4_ANGAN